MTEAARARFVDQRTVARVRPINRVWRALADPDQFGAWFIPGALAPEERRRAEVRTWLREPSPGSS